MKIFKNKSVIPPDAMFETPSQKAWKRLKKNKLAMTGLATIVMAIVIALLGYLLTPDKTPDANEMTPQIALHGPGFKIKMLKVRRDATDQTSFIKSIFTGRENNYLLIPISSFHFKDDKIVVSEYRGEGLKEQELTFPLREVLYGKNPKSNYAATIPAMQQKLLKDNIDNRYYFLGTDTFGRDILSRLIIGVRISLSVGFIAVIISLIIGIFLGAIAGYFRGRIDDIIMWLINIIWSIPTLLLVFAITLALGKGFWQIFIAVGLTMWVEVARIIRGQVLSLREMEYIEAARSLGFNSVRIITKHILPNVLGPVMVIAASNFASAILIEAGLSFLGIGVQLPTPSWGSMIKENYGFIISSSPFIAIIPGFAIMIMVLAFNLLGNGLRDALDVKTRSN